MTEIIGIVGAAGDLGSKLTVQSSAAFKDIYTFDIADVSPVATRGVDPSLITDTVSVTVQRTGTVDQILDACTIIHWVAPIHTVEALPRLAKGSLLILHDSVMSNSVKAAQLLQGNAAIQGEIAVVHCLMNNERAVAVASDFRQTERVGEHIRALGLQQKLCTVAEHDTMMAHSQGLFALMCRHYHDELHDYAERGLLPPSGYRLLAAYEDNVARWTPTTYATITSNPYLGTVAQALRESIES